MRGIRGEVWGSRGTRGGTDSPPTTSGAEGSRDRFPVLPVPPRGNGSSASAVPIHNPNLRPERMLERVSAAPRGPRPPEQSRPAGFCPSHSGSLGDFTNCCGVTTTMQDVDELGTGSNCLQDLNAHGLSAVDWSNPDRRARRARPRSVRRSHRTDARLPAPRR